MADALNEIRIAARTLAKRPGYAAVAVITLALGIGANIAIFTIVNAVLLRPLPYPDASRIVTIRHHAPGINLPDLETSPGLIELYRDGARTIGRAAGFEPRRRNVTGGGPPEQVDAIAVTPEIFDVLATRPALGRRFYETDAQQSAAPVAILTDAFWQSRFGGDPSIVGRKLELDGVRTEIVGVMPPGFAYPEPDTRLLIPLWLDPARGFGSFGVRMLARLAPGVDVDAARREIESLQARISERFPDVTSDLLAKFGWSVTLDPLRDVIVRDVAAALWILLGAVGLVLLIAGANVANLFLVPAEARRREVAVRWALGASRRRVAGTFIAESALLACAGGIGGVVLAAAGIRLLVAYGPSQLPRLHEVSIDWAVIAFAAVLSLLTALVLGVLPMSHLGQRSLSAPLRDGGRGSTAGRQRHRVRQSLIAGQVAMALVLLVGSALMLQSMVRLHAVDPGFTVEGVLTSGVSLGTGIERPRMATIYQRVLDEVSALPGVVSAGAANTLPIEPDNMNGSSFGIESRPRTDDQVPPVTMYQAVMAGYFETLGIRLLRGRPLERADAVNNRSVAWVNQTFASRFLDGRALGERIRIGEDQPWLEIAGIVGDVRAFGLREDIQPMVYLPLSASIPTLSVETMQVVVRTAGAPAALAPMLRAAVDRVSPSAPLTTVRPMTEVVASSLARMSFTMALVAIAAGIALVLGTVGLYGVIGYMVSQRTSEIGVRLALGAPPASVRAMVLRQGLGVVLVGVIVGLPAAAAATGALGSLLFEVSARDPATFGAVAALLGLVSLAATYLPARRAAAVDPVQALREEA